MDLARSKHYIYSHNWQNLFSFVFITVFVNGVPAKVGNELTGNKTARPTKYLDQ
jgi:hypothetical protein